MVNEYHRRIPKYYDHSDYNTNAQSYYDDLARKSKLIQLLSERIWEYDEELAKRFDAWDQNLEELPDDLKRMLNDWIDDGTLDHIINENIFNMKADQVDLDETNEQLEKVAVSITKFPKLSDEVDDSNRFERAVNSGYSNIILERNGIYEIDTTRFYTDNVTIHGNNATIHAKTDTSTVFLLGRNKENDPVNVKGVDIENITFVGKQTTWAGTKGSAGIHVAGHLFERNGGCSDIIVKKCKFSKFTVGIMADGVTNLLVERNLSTNNYFKETAVSGGYGVLLHSSFDVVIRENDFIGVAGDRHAIYLSNAVGTLIPNENIVIRDNVINWVGVHAITGYESAIVSRSTQGLTIDNNKISGGYGGFHLNPTAGDSFDIVVTNNIFTKNTSFEGGYREGIKFYSNPTFKTYRCLISGNRIEGISANAHGIGLERVIGAQVINNDVIVTGAGTRGMIIENTSELLIEGNKFKTDNSATALYYTESNEKITVGMNVFDGFETNEVSTSYIEKFIHTTPRTVKIVSGADGTINVVTGQDKIMNTVTKISSGVELRFLNVCNIKTGDVKITLATDDFYQFSNFTNPTNNYVYIAIRDVNGNKVPIGTVDMELIVTINN